MSSQKTLHVLGLSGGKDSAALAMYMRDNYPELDIHYYFTDTGKELPEVNVFIDKLRGYLGKEIIDPYEEVFTSNRKKKDFDYHLEQHKNYLPSPQARWCTIQMKLVPFEQWVKKKIEEEGYTEIVSYVGIRADEPARDGFLTNNVTEEYITIKMPFREDGLNRQDILNILQQADLYSDDEEVQAFRELKLGCNGIEQKLPEELLEQHFEQRLKVIKADESHPYFRSNINVQTLAKVVSAMDQGKPGYYGWRSRSGCTFCFYQQKIEWLRLMEIYPDAYEEAKQYEKAAEDQRPDGTFYWLGKGTPLSVLEDEERKQMILENHKKRYDRFIKKQERQRSRNPLQKIIYFSDVDVMDEIYDQAEGGGACVTCYK
ncbi:PAPS_reduct domain-containing protein [Alteromonas macleodii]|uniref:phosphoadenosine phosphosulfate reductase family protein n=1 Tax=Alteromonas sp. CyTr2 TaxID=2935039 RepID=UPI00248EB020|nr:phosphoadenosine phosphosulfate reductase family protein [Alteromonas sp. CyTr2]